MSSTWIQMPIENAKEVAQRYIKNKLNLSDSFTLSYNSDCEVYFTSQDLGALSFDSSVFYVGYIYCGGPNGGEETSLVLGIEDDNSNSAVMLDASAYAIVTTSYPVIWNGINPGSKETIFIGYRFNATY